MIVCIGLKNLIVVEADDALLIAEKNKVQEIKNVVEELIKKNKPEAKNNKKVFRPWGNYTSIGEDKTWQVKKIVVQPKASLSLQLHKYRSEHWTVVKGTGLVEINGEKRFLNINESAYIPCGAKHRLSNPGDEELTLIEVQSGNYLGEDDIIRFDDFYGRNK